MLSNRMLNHSISSSCPFEILHKLGFQCLALCLYNHFIILYAFIDVFLNVTHNVVRFLVLRRTFDFDFKKLYGADFYFDYVLFIYKIGT
jgi:hypothetical protein